MKFYKINQLHLFNILTSNVLLLLLLKILYIVKMLQMSQFVCLIDNLNLQSKQCEYSYLKMTIKYNIFILINIKLPLLKKEKYRNKGG